MSLFFDIWLVHPNAKIKSHVICVFFREETISESERPMGAPLSIATPIGTKSEGIHPSSSADNGDPLSLLRRELGLQENVHHQVSCVN